MSSLPQAVSSTILSKVKSFLAMAVLPLRILTRHSSK